MNELRLIPLSQVSQMGVGETVPRTKGVIKAVFPRKTGTHPQHGEWAFQNFILKDGQIEVYCKAGNKDDLSDLKGKEVWIVGFQSEKHGITGIKVDEYEGKKQLNITKTANILTNDGVARMSAEIEPDTRPTHATTIAPPKEKFIPMGQTVGMAINNACAWLIHNGKPLAAKDITQIASDILRVSKWLDEGNLMPKLETTITPAPKPQGIGIQCIKCGVYVAEVDLTGECENCAPNEPF